jgi:hypothetical protein
MKKTRSKKSRDTVPLRCLQPDIVLIICHRCQPVSLTPVANLPPVSTAQGKLGAKFAAGVVDTGGKFAAGVVNTGGNLPTVSFTPVANLPPVSLTPVVHLDLRISPRIFETI